jgi:hypothetical protein
VIFDLFRFYWKSSSSFVHYKGCQGSQRATEPRSA